LKKLARATQRLLLLRLLELPLRSLPRLLQRESLLVLRLLALALALRGCRRLAQVLLVLPVPRDGGHGQFEGALRPARLPAPSPREGRLKALLAHAAAAAAAAATAITTTATAAAAAAAPATHHQEAVRLYVVAAALALSLSGGRVSLVEVLRSEATHTSGKGRGRQEMTAEPLRCSSVVPFVHPW
jgi:hypothetical protein